MPGVSRDDVVRLAVGGGEELDGGLEVGDGGSYRLVQQGCGQVNRSQDISVLRLPQRRHLSRRLQARASPDVQREHRDARLWRRLRPLHIAAPPARFHRRPPDLFHLAPRARRPRAAAGAPPASPPLVRCAAVCPAPRPVPLQTALRPGADHLPHLPLVGHTGTARRNGEDRNHMRFLIGILRGEWSAAPAAAESPKARRRRPRPAVPPARPAVGNG